MINKSIPYGRQNITEEDIEAVIETLKSDYLTQGPKIGEFEKTFAKYVGAKYAVAVNNATAGLHLSAISLGVNSHSYDFCGKCKLCKILRRRGCVL